MGICMKIHLNQFIFENFNDFYYRSCLKCIVLQMKTAGLSSAFQWVFLVLIELFSMINGKL